MASYREPSVSVGLIISLLRWAITIGTHGRDGLGEFFGNLSVCFFFLPPWSVTPLRNMCGEIEKIDLDWMNGVSCHRFQHYKDSEGMMY